MAKKKTSKDQPVPPTKPAPKDRHKSREMIGIERRLHQQLKKLAAKNNRPITWELKPLIIKLLEENGLWPPPEGEE